MRMVMLAAVGAASVLAGSVLAQAPAPERAPASPPASSPQTPSTAPAIKSVSVIELDELPEATKTQVNELVATRTADEAQRLRNAIDKSPAVKSAIEAKGFSSHDVLVAQMDDKGTLTIIARKAG